MDIQFICLVLMFSFFSSQITFGQNKSTDTDTAHRSFTVCRMCSVSYPKKAEENNIEGTVVVQFDIDSTCSYVNIKVIKSLGYGCDEEAIKAMKNCKNVNTKSKSNCPPRYHLLQTFVFGKPKEG